MLGQVTMKKADVSCLHQWFALEMTPNSDYTRQFAATIFSATKRCNIAARLFRIVLRLFQYCDAVLR